MAAFSVACIVEGHGEVPAVPIMIRRLVAKINPAVYANVQHPIRQSKGRLLSAGGLENAVELAVRGLPESGVVLIIIDSDDSCPKELAPKLLARALQTAAGRRHVGVVLAKMEFESWFIAAAESIAQEVAAGIRAGQFPARPGWNCRHCDYRLICPAHERGPGATTELPDE